MADGGKAENEKTAPAGESAAGVNPFPGATTPPREKPLIEGQAIRIEPSAGAQNSGDSSKSAKADAGSLPLAVLVGPSETPEAEAVAEPRLEEPPPASPPPPQSAKPPQRKRANLWPLALAIVVGAAIAVGGAFGLRRLDLHRLDRTPKALAALQTRVAALEQRPAPTAPPPVDVSALNKRIDALQSDAQASGAALSRLRQAEQHLEASQQAMQKTIAARPATAAAAPVKPDLAPLKARIGTLEAKLAALTSDVGDLSKKLEAASAAQAAKDRAAQAAKDRAVQAATARAEINAVAIVAGNLRRDVQAGAPFANDLAALAGHGFDKDRLAGLEPMAASGVATPGALAKQFSALAPQILASEPEPKAKGFFGRLAQDAAHLVRIHKIGDTTGHDLDAQVARIEAALASGSVEVALQEWNRLPAAAKARSQAFGQAAQQRIAALSAAKAIEADASAALAKSKS